MKEVFAIVLSSLAMLISLGTVIFKSGRRDRENEETSKRVEEQKQLFSTRVDQLDAKLSRMDERQREAEARSTQRDQAAQREAREAIAGVLEQSRTAHEVLQMRMQDFIEELTGVSHAQAEVNVAVTKTLDSITRRLETVGDIANQDRARMDLFAEVLKRKGMIAGS